MNGINQPRVLMFTVALGYGGAESDFLRLATYFSQRAEVTVALMARDYGGSSYSLERAPTDLKIVVLDDGSERADGGVTAKARRWWRMYRRLRDLKAQHDVTISFLSGPNLLNAFAGPRGTAIVSERGSKRYHVGIPPITKWLWLRLLDPLTYRFARYIVPASTGYAEEVAAVAGRNDAGKIVPIEGSIDADELIRTTSSPVDPDISRFCAAPTAICCGRLDRGKGVDLLIPIFARIHRRNPAVRLLVIGDGPLQASLIDLCAADGLTVTTNGASNAAVFFAGYRTDPARHFRLGRVFCFPSLHEGLPNVLMEGVASGVSILAADCPWGPRSILAGPTDGQISRAPNLPLALEYGTLMPLPNTPEGAAAWEKAMAESLSEQPSAPRPASYRRAAVARFDVEVSGKQWVELISTTVLPRASGDDRPRANRTAGSHGIDQPSGLPLLAIRVANRIGRPIGVNPFPRAFPNPLAEEGGRSYEVFDEIYRQNYWGSTASRSGVGSEATFAARYGVAFAALVSMRRLGRVFDAPCGDLNWMAPLVSENGIRYFGGDISKLVIDEAKLRYPALDLRVFDITVDTFPEADVWHCRDCLFHLPFEAIHRALTNFASSRIPYALITSHRARLLHRNLDIGFGGFRFLDLERSPFSLPLPLARISDYRVGTEFPRYVCLWSREQIASSLAAWSHHGD